MVIVCTEIYQRKGVHFADIKAEHPVTLRPYVVIRTNGASQNEAVAKAKKEAEKVFGYEYIKNMGEIFNVHGIEGTVSNYFR